ncbi:chromate resistance transporter [Geothrix limicola]|uniref:Chromate resistance transporter n=1 Tax=Geothrix limicola TaxID=2927978 RepID=A0ABQ5QC63_9BACT|nr:chromate transporter [Geothrix limicola]GLH72282.1 chromate resistance transporter [Geothrix limicola]
MSSNREAVPLGTFLAYFLRLGTLGFGGPIALAGAMHRDLVEQRGWISEADYQEGLTLAQVSPGPLAAQLAIYLGYVRAGILGANLVGLVFILPSFLMVLLLAALYLRFGGLHWMQAVFYGVGAAVIGLITRSAFKLAKATQKRDALAWGIFAVVGLTTAITGREWVLLVIGGGLLFWLVKTRPWRHAPASLGLMPPFWMTGLHGPAALGTVGGIFLFFAKAGLFVFGSGLAIVPFLRGTVVTEFHWLTEQQFLDAVAVAMITPGPVVITVAFIGYLVAGPLGAVAAALGVFLPVLVVVILAAPLLRRHGQRPGLKALVQGITAGAAGAIAGAVVVLGRGAIRDLPTALIALGTLGLVWKTKIPEPVLVLAAAMSGSLLFRG